MSGDVKVLLLENVDSLGSAGDIVTVSEGYARNKLFAEGKAALATEQEQQKHKEQESRKTKQAEAELAELEERAQQLDSTELQLQAKVNEGEEIFGSITPKHIVEELNKQAGLQLSPKSISITKPIKQLGTYDMIVKLSDEVEFSMVVAVMPEPEKE
ncbi:MAG: 50S ribosomal protein L9 [Candidatus Andersenbacteria bacterium]